MILSISVPILNVIYPESIVLILLGLSDKLWKDNKYIYSLVVWATTSVSVIHAMEGIGFNIPFVSNMFKFLPLYEMGFEWLSVATLALVVSIIINLFTNCDNICSWISYFQ